MEENKEENKEVKESRVYTQEEVENIVRQINASAREQCENIVKKAQYLREQLMYRRLDYLFKVIENSGSFSMEFVKKCSNEIESALTVPESQDTGEVTQDKE